MGDEEGRLLAVGDIHGCLDRLKALMEKVRPGQRDRIVFLGDYIDRGPDPKGVIDYLLGFRRLFPGSVFLRGNHEEMFLDFMEGRNEELYLVNGGATTLASFGWEKARRLPRPHFEFLTGLPLLHEADGFVFVHAGLRPGVAVADQNPRDLLWIREEFISSDFDWGATVVFGHTPLRKTLWQANKIGLDTGAVYGRRLTCCDVKRRRCWTA